MMFDYSFLLEDNVESPDKPYEWSDVVTQFNSVPSREVWVLKNSSCQPVRKMKEDVDARSSLISLRFVIYGSGSGSW
ncbi:predicted protein [Sclerotinia sclerotiorum 1980 UF-70]|uniref:Uncharacterized protein n=1 Tax=Sclerotinia sclerotiorum (strain ATCC 18683 / 1980 / Ss-1) TaxID=665079 RepID=A7EQS9_SCLS1|nr:predicted protein [Sclerotinia sclerotiorum 1980 UF-70]EDN91821.1 predicted protein [Sclerotinia sclerotiorum 1980 UF-70]